MGLSNDQFLQYLEAGDVKSLCSMWHSLFPGMPQPKTHEDAEIVMHHARTQSASVSFEKRAYSHAWLKERCLPSGLPDHLKPHAERIYPTIIDAVGISVNTKNELLKPAALQIRGAMSDAVADVYANGDKDDIELVKSRMEEARVKESIKLFGRFSRK